MDPILTALQQRLDKNPDNITLRVAVMRHAMKHDMASRALELCLDMTPDQVSSDDDKELIASVFASIGMDDDAAQWRGNGETETQPEPAQDPEPAAKPDTGFRVVGGTEADPSDFPDDPPVAEDAPLTFADVGGLKDVKRDIERRIIAPFKQSGLLSKFKKRSGGGVLLYGPPGCGKTLIARATAGECGFNFIPVSISDILDYHVGESEKRLTALFDKARNQQPTILFFDEIDALGSKRTSSSATHHAQLVSHFLAEMDGASGRNEGVLLLAATNIPWSMDSAFLRPGRFDRLFFVPPPDRDARAAILGLELGERPTTANLKLDKIAANTSGLSGADLSLIVEDAADMAIDATLDKGEEVPIDNAMLERSAKAAKSSVTDWLTTARNYATYSNEAGRYDDILDFLKKHGRA